MLLGSRTKRSRPRSCDLSTGHTALRLRWSNRISPSSSCKHTSFPREGRKKGELQAAWKAPELTEFTQNGSVTILDREAVEGCVCLLCGELQFDVFRQPSAFSRRCRGSQHTDTVLNSTSTDFENLSATILIFHLQEDENRLLGLPRLPSYLLLLQRWEDAALRLGSASCPSLVGWTETLLQQKHHRSHLQVTH